jgi:hypothetical protein
MSNSGTSSHAQTLPACLAQHVDQLQAVWIAEGLRHLGQADGPLGLDVGIDDRLAAALPGRPLLLGLPLQIDRHRYDNNAADIDRSDVRRCSGFPGEWPPRFRLPPQRRALADVGGAVRARRQRSPPSAVGRHDPGRAGHPEVVEVMHELRIDLSDRKPRRLTHEFAGQADVVVTMACGDE